MTLIKIIGRTLVFLLAAVMVLAGVNALNSAGVLSSAPGGPPEGGFQPNRAAQARAAEAPSTMMRPNFERGEGEHESEGFSLAGLATVARNLGVISLIVVSVALLTRAIKLIDKRRTSARAA